MADEDSRADPADDAAPADAAPVETAAADPAPVDAAAVDAVDGGARRRVRPALAAAGAVVLVVLAAAAYAAWTATRDLTAEGGVYFSVPDAPRLTAANVDQTVYRIDPTRSTVGYEVTETLAGRSNVATGTTRGVAGDVLVDRAHPERSTLGQIVIDVSQLSSDQSVRDNRLRHDFLESATFPLARYDTDSVDGLPAAIADGADYPVTLHGRLTVKRTTSPVDVDATVRRTGDELHVTGRATVSLSRLGIGPVSLIGLVSAEDAATVTVDLTAVDARRLPDPGAVAFLAAGGPGTTAPTGGPSFAATVQPVLERNCASCHNTGRSGAPVWKLDTARDAAASASGIGLATETRYMPPWLASERSVPFDHSLRLSDADLAAIQTWARAGGPLDVDPSTPIRDTSPDVVHPRADLELRADAPYQGSTDLTNDYRCFVFDPKVTSPTAITGYEFVPDKTENVHHALVYRLHRESREGVDGRDRADAGTGYQCFGGVGARPTLDPSGAGGGAELVAGWAPGQLPQIYPEGTALKLDAGDFFVVQIHYHFLHAAPPDQSSLRLQLATDGADRYDNVKVTTYLAPAEIPCGPAEHGPLCDRETMLAALATDFGPTAPLIANGLNMLCGTTPAGIGVLDGTRAHASCEHRVRNTGEILSVLGHMHQIGESYRMTLNPGRTDERVLLDIPNWDFNWQLNYKPADKIVLKRGDVIKVECTWNRDRLNPAAEPRYVTWNEGTEDEMCFSTIATRETKR